MKILLSFLQKSQNFRATEILARRGKKGQIFCTKFGGDFGKIFLNILFQNYQIYVYSLCNWCPRLGSNQRRNLRRIEFFH